ncbi:hypothetical protein TPHV1_190046 [Treponema phagedenis]|uniref:Uncharacterized protein n=1 Tax=Treponema phagedenis TaxID=162 RepID=A0A0B7GS56_TREPH|nr:hypothetical protein TPHV1_190046 [Treponema phagedenis]
MISKTDISVTIISDFSRHVFSLHTGIIGQPAKNIGTMRTVSIVARFQKQLFIVNLLKFFSGIATVVCKLISAWNHRYSCPF